MNNPNVYMAAVVFILAMIVAVFTGKERITSNSLFDRESSNFFKGFAILIVIICHCSARIGGTRIFTPLGGIGVAIFLFLSGFGMQQSVENKGLRNYWGGRIPRVIIPYFLFVSVCCCLGIGRYKNYDILAYLKDIFFVDSSYWYISYIIWWYIAFYISTLLTQKIKNGDAIKMVLLLVCSILSFVFLQGYQAEQSFSFVLGVAASNSLAKLNNLSHRKILAIGFLILMCGIVFLGLKQTTLARENQFVYRCFDTLIKLPIGLGTILLMHNHIQKNKLVTIAGIVSLELYLVHCQTIRMIQRDSFIHFIVSFFIFIISTVVLTYLNHLICVWILRVWKSKVGTMK